MNFKCLFILIFLTAKAFSQIEVFELEPYNVNISGNIMQVFEGDRLIGGKIFANPTGYSVDLDGDSLNDFLVVDQLGTGTEDYYLYIFNTIDSFYLADSIHSGYFEPYFTVEEEIGEIVIITGNSSFLNFSRENRISLPVNCYRYESGELLIINDEIYDIFIQENEDLLEHLDQYFEVNPHNCSSTKQVISAISAAYANYINAGEPTLAHQLITEYYYCEDRESFTKKMDEIILN